MLEVGPGQGALTAHLLPRASGLIAVEIDPELVIHLRQRFADEPKLMLIEADVLATDLSVFGPVAVAGNLPYYITSPIIEKVLALGPLLQRATFLVQKEVAERVAAKPGSRDYGYLSALVQFQAQVELLFSVPPGAFQPPPKVDSAVFRLTPHAEPPPVPLADFQRFASRCFAQKRKTLRNNLAPFYGRERVEVLPEAGRRAEELSVGDLVRVLRHVDDTASPR